MLLRRHRFGLWASLIIGAIFVSPCVAQKVVSARASVTVTVIPSMTVAGWKAHDFGEFRPKSELRSANHTYHSLGAFFVSGQPGASVLLNFPTSLTLRGQDRSSLLLAPRIAFWSTSGPAVGGQNFPARATSGKISLDSDGRLSVWFGQLADLDSVSCDSYKGVDTVSIAY